MGLAAFLSLFGAGEGNRTPIYSLEGYCSTTELLPQYLFASGAAIPTTSGTAW